MQAVLHISPVFVPGKAGVGTLDFTGLLDASGSPIDVRDIHQVINLTRGAVCIYSQEPGFGATNIAAGPVITLSRDTVGFGSGDLLAVIGEGSSAGGGSGILAQDGTDATGVTQLTGGVGIRGWLSGIYSKVAGVLSTSIDKIGGAAVSLGLKAMSASMPVALASDQVPIPIVQPQVLVAPTTNLLTAAGAVQAQIVPGGLYSFCISIDNATLGAVANTMASCTTVLGSTGVGYIGTAPSVGQLVGGAGITPGTFITAVNPGTGFTLSLPATAGGTVTLNVTAGTFIANFRSSPDGSTWNNVNATPKTFQRAATPTDTAVAPGLWTYQAGPTDKFLQINLISIGLTGVATALTNFRLRLDIDALDRNGGTINLPYVAYVAATTTTFPTGIASLMPIETSYLSEIVFDVATLTGTAQAITWRQSSDATGTLFNAVSHTTTNTATAATALTAAAAGSYRVAPSAKYVYASQPATQTTAFNVSGVTARCGLTPAIIQAMISNTVPVSGSVTATGIAGNAAEGATAGTNPVQIATKAQTAQPTARTAGQIVAPLFSKVGHEVTKLGQIRELTTSSPMVTLTNTTETTIVAAVASTFNDLSSLVIASTATFSGSPTAARLDIRDTTAGTVRFSVSLPLTPGPVPPIALPDAYKQATVNTNWTAQLVFVGGTAPAISSGDIRITPHVFQNI